MAKFSESLLKLIFATVTIISFLAMFFNALESPLVSLIALGIVLFIGFIFLIIYYILRLEGKIDSIEQKFKRADDLKEVWKKIDKLEIKVFGK